MHQFKGLRCVNGTDSRTTRKRATFGTSARRVTSIFRAFFHDGHLLCNIRHENGSHDNVIRFINCRASCFLVNFLLDFRRFVHGTFSRGREVLRSAISGKKVSTSMGIQIVRTSNCYLASQRANGFPNWQKIGIFRLFPLGVFRTSARRFRHREIGFQGFIIGKNSSGSREEDLGRRVRGVVLFTRARTFILRLFRRTIRSVRSAINFMLPRPTRSAARVLLIWRFRATSGHIREFRCLAVGRGRVSRSRRSRPLSCVGRDQAWLTKGTGRTGSRGRRRSSRCMGRTFSSRKRVILDCVVR